MKYSILFVCFDIKLSSEWQLFGKTWTINVPLITSTFMVNFND